MDAKILKKMRQEYPSMSITSLEKLYLYDKMLKGDISGLELVRMSYLWDMISAEKYADFVKLNKECSESEDEDTFINE